MAIISVAFRIDGIRNGKRDSLDEGISQCVKLRVAICRTMRSQKTKCPGTDDGIYSIESMAGRRPSRKMLYFGGDTEQDLLFVALSDRCNIAD